MKKQFIILAALVVLGVVLYFIFGNMDLSSENNLVTATATLNTNKGDIKVELYGEDAPKTVENFLKLAREGYYDGISFHRVIPGFMIQGGDPLCGKNGELGVGPCGTGGPGYQFDDEINISSELYKTGYKKGVLAMANAGPNTNGSQFFIMVADYPLSPNYTIFGRVAGGQDVADAISKTTRDAGDRPLEAVVINKIAVE